VVDEYESPIFEEERMQYESHKPVRGYESVLYAQPGSPDST
jgi:hypothetical protein